MSIKWTKKDVIERVNRALQGQGQGQKLDGKTVLDKIVQQAKATRGEEVEPTE